MPSLKKQNQNEHTLNHNYTNLKTQAPTILMKKILISLLLFVLLTNYAVAQKVRWSYKVEGSEAGAGAPNAYTEGYNARCAAVLADNVEGKEPKKSGKSPAVIKYYFMPFDAQQVIVNENYNAGAIVKIEIESLVDNSDKTIIKTIYQGNAKPAKGYRTGNYNFSLTKNIVGVNLYIDYLKVPGVNQIAGVGLADFAEPYKPQPNLTKEIPFDNQITYMNEDVNGKLNPSTPIITVDGKYIYFNHEDKKGLNQVYKGTLGKDGRIEEVELSDFNIPEELSKSSAITAISQDNNIAYVNDMALGKPIIYRNYIRKNKKGVTSWTSEEVKFKGFESKSKYLFDCMSYDGQYYLVNMDRIKGDEKYFNNDIYVAFRNDKGDYENFTHLGFDVNTIGDEYPCFLAADNKTLVFASTGHIGFGQEDIYISKRLDDTWQNWSEPINIGNIVNTSEQENYFSIDSKGIYAYFIRWQNDQANLYRVKFHQPEKETAKTATIKPEPVVIIKGKVLDRKTNLPVQAKIVYKNILTGEIMGEATSNSDSGDYTVALPAGKFYSYLANADNYVPISENVDARNITETSEIEKNLLLVPIEVGQTIRLNNIFFDFAKATLRPESNVELDNVVKLMNDNPKMCILISGHTDNVGSNEFNLKLSDDRANAVRNYLITKGIHENRIVAQGFGETKPIATNETDEGRQTNRRVEFTILK